MTEEELINILEGLVTWRKGDQVAPHKPLMILFALSKYLNEGQAELHYPNVYESFGNLLEQYTNSKKQTPFNPFYRLYKQTPNLWHSSSPRTLKDTEITHKVLLEMNMPAGLHPEILELIQSQPRVIQRIIEVLLPKICGDSIQDDILNQLGLSPKTYTSVKNKRDPNFRDMIIQNWEGRCAVCGLSLRIQNQPTILEAAHIKWHAHGGPDSSDNGILLCNLHHKLFDLGAYCLQDNEILISNKILASDPGFETWLGQFHKKKIQKPQNKSFYPNPEYTGWHEKNVFKGNTRL